MCLDGVVIFSRGNVFFTVLFVACVRWGIFGSRVSGILYSFGIGCFLV